MTGKPNVQGIQRHKLEAHIADLIKISSHHLLETSRINEGIANKRMGAENLYKLESWRKTQTMKINAINKKINLVHREIQISKQTYKTILAQNLAATNLSRRHQSLHNLQDEAQETCLALDTCLLNSMS